MKSKFRISIFVLALLLSLTACAPAAATSYVSDEALQLQAPLAEEAPPPESPAESVAAGSGSEGIIYRTGSDQSVNIGRSSDRLVIRCRDQVIG